MAILRNSAAVLAHLDPVEGPLDTGPMRLRPLDGDGIPDHLQKLLLFLYLERVGAGTVLFDLMGSFGDGLWAVFQRVTLLDGVGGDHALVLQDIDEVPPYVRATVTTIPPDGGNQPAPQVRISFRVASNAPFTLRPANVPITLVREVTPEHDGNNHHEGPGNEDPNAGGGT